VLFLHKKNSGIAPKYANEVVKLSYRRSRGIRNTSRHISFEFLFIKTCPPDKLHNGFGFVVQFRVRIRHVIICQGGKLQGLIKRNSKEM